MCTDFVHCVLDFSKILQHMRSSGKESSMPYQVISRYRLSQLLDYSVLQFKVTVNIEIINYT